MTNVQTKLPTDVVCWLRCPVCGADIEFDVTEGRCTNGRCGTVYPILDEIPVLINEQASAFTIDQFQQHQVTYHLSENRPTQLLDRRLPQRVRNTKSRGNYDRFARELLHRTHDPTVLVIGGGILGEGMESIGCEKSIRLIESDVAFGPRTMLICDAHDIPFQDKVFDGVIAQAVLEHVADPYRCVEEIHRVLKDDGLVYAETPFMTPVHGGKYDFTRFTYLGHRRLFRRFRELDSGAVIGPATALAWSLLYFFLSLTTTSWIRTVIRGATRVLFWPLPYIDHCFIDKPAALDAAYGLYFMGQKSTEILSDRDLIELYRGGYQ